MHDDDYASLSDVYSSASDVDDGEDEVVDEDVSMADSDEYVDGNAKRKRAATTRKGKGKKKKEYKITDALKVPRATTYTAQALFDQIVNGDIDLDPEYQRDVVWPEAKQVGLIDSLFRNFYIPPVIFSVSAQEDGSETRVCIDGKQRLTSIYRFMNGLIYHRDRDSNDKLWYQDTAGPGSSKKQARILLPQKYRRLFANKQIVCVEYGDLRDKDEREIFQRVQLGMALTPAEKLGVLKSPRADFIRHLQSTFFKDDTYALSSLSWDHSRGNGFRCLATILWCYDRYLANPTTVQNTGTIQQLEKYLTIASPLKENSKNDVEKGFETFENMVANEDEDISGCFTMRLGGKDKVSPIEFICISLLILVWRTKLSMRGMAKAIGDMRKDVRSEHVDVRMNTRVGKTMITFIKNIKPEQYHLVDGSLSSPVKKEKNTKTATTKAKTNGSTPKSTKKRKRVVSDDDDADEDDASDVPPNNTPKALPTVKRKSKSTASATAVALNKSRLAGIRMAASQKPGPADSSPSPD